MCTSTSKLMQVDQTSSPLDRGFNLRLIYASVSVSIDRFLHNMSDASVLFPVSDIKIAFFLKRVVEMTETTIPYIYGYDMRIRL